ncbi:MAG: hypothetical protein AB3A66_10075 [Nodularia sp. CChRGM 3473]
MIVVSDTSSLSNLAIVNHLWLLEVIYQTVIIPEVVASELAAASNPAILAVLKLGWIQTQSLSNFQLADQLQQQRGLDAGEANAIALALELQAMICSLMNVWDGKRLLALGYLSLVFWVFCSLPNKKASFLKFNLLWMP